MSTPTVAVEFTVTRTYRADIDPKHFTGLAAFGENGDRDAYAETVQRYLEGRWTERAMLAEYYGNDDNWDGDEPEVEIEDVEVDYR